MMSTEIEVKEGTAIELVTIPELPEITELADDDNIVVGEGVDAKKISAANFKAPLVALVSSKIWGDLTAEDQELPTTRPDGTPLQNGDAWRISVPSGDDITLTSGTNSYTIPNGTSGTVGFNGVVSGQNTWAYVPQQLGDALQKGGYTGTAQDLDNKKANVADVQEAVDASSQLFDSAYVQIQDKIQFTDSLGPQGNTYYAFGFPIGVVQNFKDISLQIYKAPSGTLPTKMKLVIRDGNYNGDVIAHSQELPVSLTATQTTLKFSFTDIIENVNGDRLWCEIFADGVFGIYIRYPNATSIFTAANGYSQSHPMLTNVYDSEDIDYTAVSGAYLDVWAKFSQYEKTYTIPGYTPSGGSNLDMQQMDNKKANTADVQPVIDITNEVFETKNVQQPDYTLFTDNLGPFSSIAYAMGFPMAPAQNFKDISLQIYKAPSGTLPTKMKLLVKTAYNGTLVARSQELSVNLTATQTLLKFSFDEIIPNAANSKLWLELYADGVFGVYVRNPNPASIFTSANGYSPATQIATNVYDSEVIDYTGANQYKDFWEKFSQYETEIALTPAGISIIGGNSNQIDRNARISMAGSSVTWGNGRLQSGFVQSLIWAYQESYASTLVSAALNGGTNIVGLSYYRQSAKRISGVNSQLEFSMYGNEVSIVTAKERDNTNASLIDVYIDGTIVDTIDNTNTDPTGSETKNFTGDGTAVKFDLGRCFTYGHAVTVNGTALAGSLNISQGTGASPTQDYLVIRKYGDDGNGNPEVHHWIWFKTAPAAGAAISVNYSYGHLQAYEKTTIGQDANGNDECPYGDGDVSFDTTNPAAIGSGLDFREVDESVVYTYRFTSLKSRDVVLKIKSLAPGATGTPYFIFNFATNRIFYFQNAGIGGWSLFYLNQSVATKYLLGWQRVVEWNPDIIITDVTPNEDWTVNGHKAYTNATNVPLAEFQTTRMMPCRSMNFDDPNYSYSRWIGKIALITETSVTASADTSFDTNPVAGDYVMMGVAGVCSKDYIVRRVKTYTSATKTITWDMPIRPSEINFALTDMVGMELRVRDFTIFTNALNTYINNVKSVLPEAVMGFIPNPYPNLPGRELWGYKELINEKCYAYKDVWQLDTASVQKWQNSQILDETITFDATDLLTDSQTGLKYIDTTGVVNGLNNICGRPQVLIDGVDVYGKYAYVLTGYYYRPASTGAAVNLAAGENSNVNLSVLQWNARIVFFKDAPTDGDIVLKYTSSLWAADNTHMNTDAGPVLFSNFIGDFLKNK